MRVAIIGAGPAGMTAAYQLTKGGAAVEVFEASPFVGGLSRTHDSGARRSISARTASSATTRWSTASGTRSSATTTAGSTA